jgi:Zn-dependent protease with chaperone function
MSGAPIELTNLDSNRLSVSAQIPLELEAVREMVGTLSAQAGIPPPRFDGWTAAPIPAAYCARQNQLLLEQSFARLLGGRVLFVVVAHEVGHARQRQVTLRVGAVSQLLKISVVVALLAAALHLVSWLFCGALALLVLAWLGFVACPFGLWRELDADRFAALHASSPRAVAAALLRTYRLLDMPRDWSLYARLLALKALSSTKRAGARSL